jgi:hypothetical protein
MIYRHTCIGSLWVNLILKLENWDSYSKGYRPKGSKLELYLWRTEMMLWAMCLYVANMFQSWRVAWIPTLVTTLVWKNMYDICVSDSSVIDSNICIENYPANVKNKIDHKFNHDDSCHRNIWIWWTFSTPQLPIETLRNVLWNIYYYNSHMYVAYWSGVRRSVYLDQSHALDRWQDIQQCFTNISRLHA